ncbi:MAG TPA: hypothetical protein VGE34_03860 [Candidatus Saccharimonadales bacterium]
MDDIKPRPRRPRPTIRSNTAHPHAARPDNTQPQLQAQTQPTTIRKLSLHQRLLQQKKKLLIYGVVVAAVAVASSIYFLQPTTPTQSPNVVDTPQFQTVLPIGEDIAKLGGWKRVSPPDKPGAYAYDDTIGSIAITVSQQRLPNSFKSNTADAITQLAKSYNATEKLTADDTTFYVGASANGPQSVIFTKNDLLILIKSKARVSNKSWVKYIAKLAPTGSPQPPQY